MTEEGKQKPLEIGSKEHITNPSPELDIPTNHDRANIEADGLDTDDEIRDIQAELNESNAQPLIVNQADEHEAKDDVESYISKHLPDYLRGKKGIVERTITELWIGLSSKFEVEGTENIPETGPFLAICNHFGGGDAEALMATFKDRNPHLVVAKRMWWDTPFKFFLKKLGSIPIEESLSNLTLQEKEEALKRQGNHGKEVFREIIDRESAGQYPVNTEFVRQAIAALLQGDALAIFPEGLWLNPEGTGTKAREHKEMKRGYPGIELIARQYKKLTGKNLPILPTAYIESSDNETKRLTIGPMLNFDQNETGLSNTDWAMTHIARMLPEGQRGYYKDLISQMQDADTSDSENN